MSTGNQNPRSSGRGEVKPHFRKLHGVWHCGVRGIPNKRIGLGYSPKAAYLDWLGVGHG